jgi:hypothetical protein
MRRRSVVTDPTSEVRVVRPSEQTPVARTVALATLALRAGRERRKNAQRPRPRGTPRLGHWRETPVQLLLELL